MLQQALDFREESEAVFALLDGLDEQDWAKKTQFKAWTINDIIAHLHMGNYAADLSLQDTNAFPDLVKEFAAGSKQYGRLAFTHVWLDGLRDRALLQRWRDYYLEMTDRFAAANPKQRVQWFGPDMSVRSSITARLMETWAHSQAIYDLLGQTRIDTDRIKNVVVMGVNTFGWTFTNRNLAVPTDIPHLRLSAPSGEVWEWNQPDQDKPHRGQRGRVLSGGHPGAQYRGHRTSRERRYGHQMDGHGAVLCRTAGRAARTGQPLPASLILGWRH